MFSFRTILAEPQSELRSLIAQNLQAYCDSDVAFAPDADGTNALLSKDPRFDLIVCSARSGGEAAILRIFYHVRSLGLDIPMIAMSDGDLLIPSSRVHPLPYPGDWRAVIKKAAKVLGVTSQDMARKKIPDYFPVFIKNLLGLDTAPCFVFLKLHDKFEPLFAAGDDVDKDALKRLILKGVRTVYVEKSWRLSFVNAVSDRLADEFRGARSGRDHMEVLAKAIDNTHELIRVTGINQKSVVMANRSMQSMMESVKCSEGLSELISILEEESDSYPYKHCVLTNIVACRAIGGMDWGTKIQQEKIAFICFFHDITIPEERLCSIHGEAALEASGLSAEDKGRVRSHAADAVRLLKNHPQIPFGVEPLILQHHGTPNGVGFGEGLNTAISPISITFRVCEDLVHAMLRLGKKFHMDTAIEELMQKHTRRKYRDVVLALDKMGG